LHPISIWALLTFLRESKLAVDICPTDRETPPLPGYHPPDGYVPPPLPPPEADEIYNTTKIIVVNMMIVAKGILVQSFNFFI
jgi:hypothetical protein